MPRNVWDRTDKESDSWCQTDDAIARDLHELRSPLSQENMHAIRISGRTTIDCSTAYSRNECRNSRMTPVMPEMGNKPEQNANTLGIGMMTPGHVSQNSLQWKGFRNYPSITHTTSCKRNCFYKQHAKATTSIHLITIIRTIPTKQSKGAFQRLRRNCYGWETTRIFYISPSEKFWSKLQQWNQMSADCGGEIILQNCRPMHSILISTQDWTVLISFSSLWRYDERSCSRNKNPANRSVSSLASQSGQWSGTKTSAKAIQ